MYGATGNGKTTIARSLGATLPGYVLIPYAIEMLGHVVKLHDPSKHLPAEVALAKEVTGLLRGEDSPPIDGRWALCKRPAVLVAGEMARHSLELVYDPRGKVYEAPLQMKANGGMMIVDDFGRQQIPAVELLNRWIVALESRVDHLTLHTGQTVRVPFDVLPLFATNLAPESLADDAFLRRIRYKVEIPSPSSEEYEVIFRRVCRAHSLAYDEGIFSHLVLSYYESTRREMRACHPRDIVEAIVDAARHDGKVAKLSREAVDEACQTYFLS
jgi:predicted ATPase with chaperone activity